VLHGEHLFHDIEILSVEVLDGAQRQDVIAAHRRAHLGGDRWPAQELGRRQAPVPVDELVADRRPVARRVRVLDHHHRLQEPLVAHRLGQAGQGRLIVTMVVAVVGQLGADLGDRDRPQRAR
jgi:hypothetical protein